MLSLLAAFSSYLSTTNVLVSIVAGLLIYKWSSKNKLNLPPGPIGLPIVGSILSMEVLAERTFAKWTKLYGPVMTVQLGQVQNVVLNSYEAIEEAFVKQGNLFTGRHRTFFTEFASENGHGIVFLNDENSDRWKVQRRFGSRAIVGTGLRGKKMEDRILEEAETLCNVIRSKNGEPFILESTIIRSIANVINGITLQRKCDEEGNELLLKYINSVIDGFRKDGMAYSFLGILPWTRFLPPIRGHYLEMVEGINLGNSIMDNFIAEHEATLDPKEPRDFIDLFLLEHQKKTPSFSKTQLRFYLKDVFAAGTETTASTIRWTILRLVKHQDIQENIHREIDHVIGTDGKIRADTNLPYTKAVIQETFRIQPATPLGVPRCTTEDVEFMGFHIPKNTQIIPNLWWIHNNPDIWPNPEIFDPNRHLDDSGQFVKSPKIIPFSIGPRYCLGENLARMEVFIFIVSILQKFKLCVNPELPNVNLKCSGGIVASAEHYPIIMKER